MSKSFLWLEQAHDPDPTCVALIHELLTNARSPRTAPTSQVAYRPPRGCGARPAGPRDPIRVER